MLAYTYSMTTTRKLTPTQTKALEFYRTGVWPAGLQTNHMISAERALRGMGLIRYAEEGETARREHVLVELEG